MQVPNRALVVGAHPDDCEYGAGETVALWASAGCEVHFCIVTDGSKGTADLELDTKDLVERRRGEQLAAARILGVEHCQFLGFPDGEVENDRALLEALVGVIREVRPEVVLTHSPEPLDHNPFRGSGKGVNHRDHRAVAQATLDAVYPYARNPNSFPHLAHDPHKVQRVLLWGARFPDVSVGVGEMNLKQAALATHTSQFPGNIDWGSLLKSWGQHEEFESVEFY